jgi:hypothetical protein
VLLEVASHPLVGRLIAAGVEQTNSGPGGWMPELRGILTVIIGVFVLMGSVYALLGTNIGFRLGFLVAFTGFFAWMFIMGAVWWAYGIGLKGPEGSWDAMPGRTVLQDTAALTRAGALDGSVDVPADATPAQTSVVVADALKSDGWRQLDEAAPMYGQTASQAEVFLTEAEVFEAGGYKVVNVFDTGGERYPVLADGAIDFLAFWHKPRYVLVEVAPVVQQRVEPGRAPATPRIDETQPHQYVYMLRNLGAKRVPAGLITVGSLVVFLICCWLLHRRERTVAHNRSQLALPAKA